MTGSEFGIPDLGLRIQKLGCRIKDLWAHSPKKHSAAALCGFPFVLFLLLLPTQIHKTAAEQTKVKRVS